MLNFNVIFVNEDLLKKINLKIIIQIFIVCIIVPNVLNSLEILLINKNIFVKLFNINAILMVVLKLIKNKRIYKNINKIHILKNMKFLKIFLLNSNKIMISLNLKIMEKIN